MKNRFKTVKCEATAEIVEKRSRFIAAVKPVKTEEEALGFLEAIKKKHWNARHNVFAYVLEENNIQRYSDDGEPAGTAGVPVLDLIKKEGLSDIIVVVTRYFGGVLLGTGGLVRAYSAAAKAGVLSSGTVQNVLCERLDLIFDYSFLGKVQSELMKNREIITGSAEYSDAVKFPVFVPLEQAEAFAADLNDKLNGQLRMEKGEIGYKFI